MPPTFGMPPPLYITKPAKPSTKDLQYAETALSTWGYFRVLRCSTGPYFSNLLFFARLAYVRKTRSICFLLLCKEDSVTWLLLLNLSLTISSHVSTLFGLGGGAYGEKGPLSKELSSRKCLFLSRV